MSQKTNLLLQCYDDPDLHNAVYARLDGPISEAELVRLIEVARHAGPHGPTAPISHPNKAKPMLVKFIGIYFVQIGALWGILEGFTYFQGDLLKDVVGPFWVLLYIIPLITTAVIVGTTNVVSQDSPDTPTKVITTQGSFSPGEVGQDYTVTATGRKLPISQGNKQRTKPEISSSADQQIHTAGDYSPGEVKGDYNIEF